MSELEFDALSNSRFWCCIKLMMILILHKKLMDDTSFHCFTGVSNLKQFASFCEMIIRWINNEFEKFISQVREKWELDWQIKWKMSSVHSSGIVWDRFIIMYFQFDHDKWSSSSWFLLLICAGYGSTYLPDMSFS